MTMQVPSLAPNAIHNPPGSKVYRLLRGHTFRAEHFDGRLPDELTRRISTLNFPAPLPSAFQSMFSRSTGESIDYSWDLARGIINAHEKNPELFASWTGTGFTSLVDHAVAVGGLPVTVPLFSLDPEVAGVLAMRDIAGLAGAARLAVRGTKVSDLPTDVALPHAKYQATSAPPIDSSVTVRRALLYNRYPHFVPLIELMTDVDDDTIRASLGRLDDVSASGIQTFPYVAALLVQAATEGLPLGECFRVWSLVPGDSDLVLRAVREGIADEFLVSVAG